MLTFLLAYLLNLRGSDIPFNPLFYAYLFISLDRVILFLDATKLADDTKDHLHSLKVERREYNDIWPFLRRREWGEGKLLLCPETPYAISLMLTHFRYTVVPSHVDNMKAVKNEVELDGLRRAYLRDGAAYVCPMSASPVSFPSRYPPRLNGLPGWNIRFIKATISLNGKPRGVSQSLGGRTSIIGASRTKISLGAGPTRVSDSSGMSCTFLNILCSSATLFAV